VRRAELRLYGAQRSVDLTEHPPKHRFVDERARAHRNDLCSRSLVTPTIGTAITVDSLTPASALPPGIERQQPHSDRR